MLATRTRPRLVATLGTLTSLGSLILGQGCPAPTAAPSSSAEPSSSTDFEDLWGPRFKSSRQLRERRPRPSPSPTADLTSRIRHWNEIMLDANALDHTPLEPDEIRVFGEQAGPARTARAFAMVHVAMFDAANAVVGGYRGYTDLDRARGASVGAAVAQAAHDTLAELYASQAANFDALLEKDLARIPNGEPRDKGIELGRKAAAAILALRADDGSTQKEPRVGIEFITSDEPGKWRQDPISRVPVALGADWGQVRPYVMKSSEQFLAPPPPALDSPEYASAFEEVKRLGGDGILTPTERTAEQTTAAIYWGYDGTPGLGTPPRFYNQITLHVAEQMGTEGIELARLLALLNVTLADASVACWKTKYVYQFWRPITAIREADEGTGPTGAGDGNPDTTGNPEWTPLGAPASNLDGPNFTPPFPAYPSGHATFGAATFQILRRFYKTDNIAFTFVSDEFNGVTQDNEGSVRPRIPRSFSSLSQAEEDNGQSRIYLGIHWAFDKTSGIAQGRAVADYVFDKAFARKAAESQE